MVKNEKMQMFKYKVEEYKNGRKFYTVSNYDITPMPQIIFIIPPTQYTQKVFKMIWDRYDIKENSALINIQDLVNNEYSYFEEIRLIQTIQFSKYAIKDNQEVFIDMPIITEVLKTPYQFRIKFHKNFKRFFDEYLEL